MNSLLMFHCIIKSSKKDIQLDHRMPCVRVSHYDLVWYCQQKKKSVFPKIAPLRYSIFQQIWTEVLCWFHPGLCSSLENPTTGMSCRLKPPSSRETTQIIEVFLDIVGKLWVYRYTLQVDILTGKMVTVGFGTYTIVRPASFVLCLVYPVLSCPDGLKAVRSQPMTSPRAALPGKRAWSWYWWVTAVAPSYSRT